MKEDDEIFKTLIAGGIIGAALSALLFKEKESSTVLGAIAGAVLLATFKANQQAKKTNVLLCTEEDGILFEIQPGGEKKFIKNIEKSNVVLSKHFKLK